jgi:hypothetical protein
MPTKTKLVAKIIVIMGALSLISIFSNIILYFNHTESSLWMYFFGSVGSILIVLRLYLLTPLSGIIGADVWNGNFLFFFPFLLISILMIIFGILLLKGKKFSWWIIFFLLTLLLILDILPSTILFGAYIIPIVFLILLYSDKRKFFEFIDRK